MHRQPQHEAEELAAAQLARGAAVPVKVGETRTDYALEIWASRLGWLIQVEVGNPSGWGRRDPNRSA